MKWVLDESQILKKQAIRGYFIKTLSHMSMKQLLTLLSDI